MYSHRDDISNEIKKYEKKIKEKNSFFQYCIKCCNEIKKSIHYSIISDYITYFRNLIKTNTFPNLKNEIIYVIDYLKYAHKNLSDSSRIINDLKTNCKNFIEQNNIKLQDRILMQQKDLLQHQKMEEKNDFYDQHRIRNYNYNYNDDDLIFQFDNLLNLNEDNDGVNVELRRNDATDDETSFLHRIDDLLDL
jgi:hypothetical protein